MIPVKSFLTGALYDSFKLIYAYLSEGDKVHECCSCFKMMMQSHLHVCFFKIFFIKRALLKGALEGLRQFLVTESPLKMMKNAFYFTLKALFVLKLLKFLS